ncbi:HD family phosphohydrolase [Candidatus Acidulodesulfobacterium sp. H_13]|uniref:HD family phosphohydrolase n=1 Tax=Candidatus Acidulodesulfobacterium sp. H_13 TaxID=3395470 RepID=UPI003AF7812B
MKRTKFLEFLKNNTLEIKNRHYPLLALLLISAVFLTFLLYNGSEFVKNKYKAGEIATKTIIAKKSFRYVDLKATDAVLKRKIRNSPDVYLYYPEEKIALYRKVKSAFVLAKLYKKSHPSGKENTSISKSIFSDKLGIKLDDATLNEFYYLNYNKNIESYVLQIMADIYKRGVLSKTPSDDKSIEIKNVMTNRLRLIGDPQIFFTLKKKSGFAYYYVKNNLGFLPLYMRNDIYRLVYNLIKPDIVYSRFLTLKKIEDIKKENMPIYIHIKRGILLVNSGELISKAKAIELNAYNAKFSLKNNIPLLIGLFLLIVMLLSLSYVFPYKYIRKFRTSLNFKNIVFVASVLISSVIIIKAGIIFSGALSLYFPFINENDIYYLIPFAFGPMLIRIILNSEVSVVYIALFSILTSMIFKNSIFFMIYAFGGSLIASYEVFDFSSWGRMVKAGVITGFLNSFMVLTFALIGLNFINVQNIYSVILAFLSGVVSSIMVIGLIPVFERIFGFTTDFKLLELSGSNHPLLRQFSVVAPGTYQHSIMVATLAESAALSVGANPLLTRVASLYHDIGKILKPNYFIENTVNFNNPHNKLAPTMSSLIIASHVKEGLELAKKHKLGDKIENIINEHHGTSMIGAFYEKAFKENGGANISKGVFRYDGRKPQTKEAGIIMLADSVEATSRTVTNISPSRLESLVRKTISRIYNDGQLDECELTLKDLHSIGDAFVKVLNSIFHQRIPYAGKSIEEDDGDGKSGDVPNKYNEYPKKVGNKPKVSLLYR